MINVIFYADVIGQADNIVNGSKNIVFGNVFGDQIVLFFLHGNQNVFGIGMFRHNFRQHLAGNHFVDTRFFHAVAQNLGGMHHTIGEYLANFSAVTVYVYSVNARIFYGLGGGA